MKYMVAPTYQSWKVDRIDEEAKKVHVYCDCWKCGGSGQYAWFGTCYACGGSGHQAKWVKAYTKDEYAKYIAAQEKAKERKAQKAAAKQKELMDNSEANKKVLLEKFGFDAENPKVYLVAGENTFDIKDELKERGGRYKPEFNWHFTKPTELPEGYKLVAIDFDEVYDWNPLTQHIGIKENAKQIAEEARAKVAPKSNSEWIGEIKQRMRDLKVVLTGARAVSSAYGESIMFTFKQGENILVWFTSCPPADEDAIVGHEYLLTGTVKDHKVYNGTKQTYLNRCKLKEFAI